eukprot:403333106
MSQNYRSFRDESDLVQQQKYEKQQQLNKKREELYAMGDNVPSNVCLVCTEQIYDQNTFYALKVSDINSEEICGHKFCQNCWIYMIGSQMSEGKVFNIKCMMRGCQGSVQDNDIQNLLLKIEEKPELKEILKTYQRIKLRRQIDLENDVIWCPKTDCDGFAQQAREQLIRNNLHCNVCNQGICGKCGREEHIGYLCKDHHDIKTQEFFEICPQMTRCPMCKCRIERYGSYCNQQTCSFCNYTFCTKCETYCFQDLDDFYYPFSCPGQPSRISSFNYKLKYYAKRILKLIAYTIATPYILGATIFFTGWFSLMYLHRRYDEYGEPTGADMSGLYALLGVMALDVTYIALMIFRVIPWYFMFVPVVPIITVGHYYYKWANYRQAKKQLQRRQSEF